MSGLWNKVKNFGMNFLGLGGKRNGGVSGLVNKAKNFIGSGMNFISSKPVKSLVDSVSQYLPSVGSFYKDVKKYGSIANSMLNQNGLNKMADRFVKNKVEPSIERVNRNAMQRKENPFDPIENVDTGNLFS